LNRLFVSVLRWVAALTMPVFLLLTVSRLMIADWYPSYEYAKPDFPADRYGWTQQERLDLALPSIHFLNSLLPADQAIGLLSAQVHLGTRSLLFTRNELSHMEDVKRLVDALWRVQVIAGVLMLGSLVILFARRETRRSAYLAMMAGGILTTALLFVLVFLVLAGFDALFVQFHEIFFPQGNWTFDYNDSLIRLFPEKLWFDAGFMITAGTFLAGVIVGLVGFVLWRRSDVPELLAASEP
jgi:integral membrane protein (TIGR01906 family)